MEKANFYERPAEDLAEVFNYTEKLLEHYGFNESPEMVALRYQIGEGDHDNIGPLMSRYQELGEGIIGSLEGRDYTLGQINLIIATATLKRDAGNIEGFLDGIDDAKDYAYNVYEDELVEALEYAPSVELARVLHTLGQDYGFDNETVAEVAIVPYEQAFEMSYSYITQAGLDADQILSVFVKDSDVPHASDE